MYAPTTRHQTFPPEGAIDGFPAWHSLHDGSARGGL